MLTNRRGGAPKLFPTCRVLTGASFRLSDVPPYASKRSIHSTCVSVDMEGIFQTHHVYWTNKNGPCWCMTSKTMTAVWSLFSLFYGSLSLKPLAATMFAVTLWWNISRLFLRLQVILRGVHRSVVVKSDSSRASNRYRNWTFPLSITSNNLWHHTTCKKITYDILPWVTQSSWQMSWRFISLPEVMENHSRRNPVGGVQRIEGHFFIQISPHGAELDRAEKVPRSKWKLKLRQLYSMQPYYTPASNVTFYSMLLLQNSFICFLVVENQSDSTMYLRI